MIEKEDYRKYLSIDNGKGLLINKNDAFILEQYGIDYMKYTSMNDLILIVGNYIDDHYDEELDSLEEVLEHLIEVHYYMQVKK